MTPSDRLTQELEEAERKAWDSLARYKFAMFGYWCGIWVHLNRITGSKRPNPWQDLVRLARAHVNPDTPAYGHTAVPAPPQQTRPPRRSARSGRTPTPTATDSGEIPQ